MLTRVRILSLGSAPRAIVVEKPSWLGVLLGAEYSEWLAFGVPGLAGQIEWYRDTREDRPRRVTARRVIEALERELRLPTIP